ncbi:hypothetical protein [Kurthia massiliensis]|uniref:hypothetical protein n=1 Tax=Kurthia massiliensis TaxID=1033739 RepID=UPI000288FE03|nr:hypothetical protein [Kurthia massiliensis]
MVLAKGITGFCSEDVLHTVEEIDAKAFRSACYDAALHPEVTLVNIIDCDYPFTYHKAIFNVNDERVIALLNNYYPIIGFVKDDDPLVFCDIPAQLQSLSEHYTLLDEDALMTYPTSEQLTQLDEYERHNIQHWAPRNLGEIIFNTWD